MGGGFDAWRKILPRCLQSGGAADWPLPLLHRGKRSDARIVWQELWRPVADFAGPFWHASTATDNGGPGARGILRRFEVRQRLSSVAKGRSEEHTSELQSLTNLVC